MSASFRIAVFVSGGGTNLQALIDAQERGDFRSRIVAVLSNRASAYGLERACRHGIDTLVIDPDDPDVPTPQAPHGWLAWLRERGVDLLLLAGYLKRIPEGVIRSFRGRIYNIHPALLPKYGGKGCYGMHVHRAVLDSGDHVSGATIHAVTPEYDEGEHLIQETVDIGDCKSPEEIASRVLEVEHRIYPRAVRLLEEGALEKGEETWREEP